MNVGVTDVFGKSVGKTTYQISRCCTEWKKRRYILGKYFEN